MSPNVVSGSGVVANNHEAIIEKSDGTVLVLKLPEWDKQFRQFLRKRLLAHEGANASKLIGTKQDCLGVLKAME